ncbi:LIC_12616 family protein [Lysinibacillus sp. NPDC097162]|uniref:phage neck terminator protein n=1 Tax=Lysinibacillus sp. NPDC097162 TaxID=3364140 RepID=UPI0038010D75
MNLVKSIRKQLAADTAITIIRADQLGDVPKLPYATYKVISDRKGVGQEDVSHVDNVAELVEARTQERNSTLSFNIYGTSHDNAYEVATQLRKWFEWRGSLFLDELNVAVANLTDVTNRTTFLLESYDEKWGFDAIIRYQEIDEHEIDYFDKVEVEMKLGR